MNDDDFFRPMATRDTVALAIITTISICVSFLAAYGAYCLIFGVP